VLVYTWRDIGHDAAQTLGEIQQALLRDRRTVETSRSRGWG
jgi:hypothetical protein